MTIFKYIKTTINKEVCLIAAETESEASDLLNAKNLDGSEWNEESNAIYYDVEVLTKDEWTAPSCLNNKNNKILPKEIIVSGLKANEAYILSKKDFLNV